MRGRGDGSVLRTHIIHLHTELIMDMCRVCPYHIRTYSYICPLCRLTIYLYTHTTIRRCVHGKELHNTQCNKPGYQKRPCVVIARVPCDSCLVLVGLAELDVRHVHRHAHHCMQQHMCPTVRLPEHVCFLMAPMACSTRCR
jgi:hypothetical protein